MRETRICQMVSVIMHYIVSDFNHSSTHKLLSSSVCKMFEAKLGQGNVFKKVLEAIKDLVPNANWECSSSGINVQAMDSSHVSLVSISLEADGFEPYRCDRNVILGMETANLSKILKCASNDDSITIKAEEGGDMVTFQFDSQSKYYLKISML